MIGARPITQIQHFSFVKKLLQKFGSYVVRRVSMTDIPDAPSGFRAISRDAALKLNVFNAYTYTLETIIQAGRKNMAITWVPVRVNEDLRPSRLVKSIPSYIKRSIITIFRIFVVYEPFRFFLRIGLCNVSHRHGPGGALPLLLRDHGRRGPHPVPRPRQQSSC